MRRFLTITLMFAFLMLAACSSNAPDGLAGEYGENNMPDWMEEFYSEEELESGELLFMHTSADYQSYPSVEQLIASAVDELIMARVIDERVEWLDYSMPHSEEFKREHGITEEHVPRYMPYVVHRVEVLEVFKGELVPGDIIEIAQIGGQMERVKLINDNLMEFEEGEILIFLLSDPSFDEGRENVLPYFFTNPWQTVFRVTQGIVTMDADGNERIDNAEVESFDFHPDLTLTLTMGDLQRIQQENFGVTGG